MLETVKLALRISTAAFDTELQLLIDACTAEMAGLGVIVGPDDDGNYNPQIIVAVIAYCKWRFGNHEDKDQWLDIYHTSLKQLKTMTGFTTWTDQNS